MLKMLYRYDGRKSQNLSRKGNKRFGICQDFISVLRDDTQTHFEITFSTFTKKAQSAF